ncbi:ComEC/Rec2 family competence protein [Streptomyces sp. WI03-4A]|uniref:ComEC/Rec2 family competence protein n=1 Tax=Streptomyces sp. WI03-4A TaxID=3028706 RepID=UPI0029AB8D50|nr:ComEC/Rec2 family competence protein [Streptomyces sp. WI03-4A]MDX2596092.1 ComEC/Rec2 family competence protein [Streptomyces sp. WI03-4A]
MSTGPGPSAPAAADLRLVPPALAAWATAALVIDAPPRWSAGVAAVGLITGAALLGVRRWGRPDRTPTRPGWVRAPLAAVLLCVAAAAASAGLHGADLRRGPVPEAARRFATITAEVELTGDPWPSRPRVRGDHAAPVAVLARAEVRRVEEVEGVAGREGRDGAAVGTRTPVLLVIDADVPAPRAPPAGAAAKDSMAAPDEPAALKTTAAPDAPYEPGVPHAAGAARQAWLGLLPTTRLRIVARPAPALSGGDRSAAVLRVRADPRPEVVAGPSGPQRLAGGLRAGLRDATEGLPADARALLPGLVVGDTSRITPELDEAFKETDLAHTLAVSGSNLTILLALLVGPPGLAQRAERRGLAPRLGLPLRATALLAGALTLAFVVVCRPDPSVLRAAACGSVALLALATGRRRSLVPALAAAVLLLVLYDPWLARSYGFLLSVLATGALLLTAPGWSEALRRRGVPARLAEALAAAAAAQAVCAPVVAVLSARVSLVAVPCNLLAEAAVAPATVLGFAALATAPVAMPVARGLAWCAGWPAGWIARVARTGAALPGGGVDWSGSWAGALLLAAVTGAVVLAGRRLSRHPWWCGALGVLFLLVVVRPAPLARVVTGWPPPGWRYAMCDVGQGDATVLSAGEGAGVVVDTGPDPGRVDRCLRKLGITQVPLVVLTHFHADHVAGLPGVLRGRSVAAIETTDFEEPADQVAFVRKEAAERHIPLTRAAAGEERRTGPVTWRVLWPPAAPAPGQAPAVEPDGPNDASVALLVRTGGLRLLLLGDLEPPSQQALAHSPAAAGLAGVDVLKVAHHGSAYQDPDLIRLAAPRVALISCGADNPYGHPAPATVAALRAGGATVLRTDRDGALAIGGGGGAGADGGGDGGGRGGAADREVRVTRD